MIRELREEDVPAVVAIINGVDPYWAVNEAGFRHGLATRPARLRYLRLVADEDGEVVAWGAASLFPHAEAPESGAVTVMVRDDRRGRGIGSELLERALAHLRAAGALRARAEASVDEGARFLEAHGFSRTHTAVLSELDPRRADVSELEDLRGRKAAEGFTLAPISACSAEEVHRVDAESARDTPGAEPITHVPFEEWLVRRWRDPMLTREGSFAVVHEARPVAIAMLLADLERGRAQNGGTGTLRAFRRRGLARLAKLGQVQWAAASGITSIATDNDETNAPMLAINARLGYQPYGELLSFARELP